MISRTLIAFGTLLFTTVLSLPIYSYDDFNSPTFMLYRDEGFLPLLEPEYGGVPSDARGKRSFYGLYKKLNEEAYKRHGYKKSYQ